MGNERTQSLFIGKDLPWKQFDWHFFRVEHFLPLSSVEQGRIKDISKFKPYAILRVYDPNFESEDEELSLPVLHKLDFIHLWEVYRQRGITQDEEVVVHYEPPSGARMLFGNIFPQLRIEVKPQGSLDYIVRFLNNEEKSINWDNYNERTRAIATWDPMMGRIL